MIGSQPLTLTAFEFFLDVGRWRIASSDSIFEKKLVIILKWIMQLVGWYEELGYFVGM